MYERLLDHRGWVLPAQELHLHLLTDVGQVSGEVTKRQALLNGVAVRPRGCVPDHLDGANRCVHSGVANKILTMPGISLIMVFYLSIVPDGLIALRIHVVRFDCEIRQLPL